MKEISSSILFNMISVKVANREDVAKCHERRMSMTKCTVHAILINNQALKVGMVLS